MYIVMNITVSKWGNSLGIRIPKAVTEELRLHEGSSLSLVARPDGYLLKPAQPEVSYLLGDLVEQMRGEAEPDSIDWGTDVGEEVIEDGGW